ncbi:hypothetical protein [Actinoplanes sp. L3-i22]|uniref:hypothetical protein n=1 Tax=Actinoplanes sp. L3-i22 TaxID=2836373 RepID=UPI001C781750|nr:hypothetical protein [Actinoplanes sp. L3-i22]BCY12707.1 hypothetical protein L3i22_077950 [Actinoplanes sp. L3-i22]
MSISIGISTPSSAWETHAAWLRLRGDCQQLFDHVLAGADHRSPAGDQVAELDSRDAIARMEQSSGVNTLV